MMLRSQLPEEPLASWIVLCVGNDPSRLLLYRSLLELDGYSVLLAETVEDGLELSRKKMIDCIVLDHARGGAVLAQEIGRRRATPPLVFVLEGSEIPVHIYPHVEMFISREEAIEALSRCIEEVLDRCRCERAEARRVEPAVRLCTLPHLCNHRFVRRVLPWSAECLHCTRQAIFGDV
jgi:CheY-like chemotaxis protein